MPLIIKDVLRIGSKSEEKASTLEDRCGQLETASGRFQLQQSSQSSAFYYASIALTHKDKSGKYVVIIQLFGVYAIWLYRVKYWRQKEKHDKLTYMCVFADMGEAKKKLL